MTLDDLRNKRVGVVFSSGFFGFFAHAGCLKALEELGISPVGYAGTSSGAIVAALAASGLNARAIDDILFNLNKSDFWDPEPWYKTLSACFKLFRGSRGYLEGRRFKQLLENSLPVKSFEHLKTPCVIVAANLTRKKREIITSGSLADAVQASGTIPWTFKIKKIGEDFFLDGGLIDKAPVEALLKHVQPEVIIVHYIVSSELTETENAFLYKRFTPGKAYRLSMSIARHEHYLTQKQLAEMQGVKIIELKPSLPRVTPDRLYLGRQAYDAAYKHTLQELGSEEVKR